MIIKKLNLKKIIKTIKINHLKIIKQQLIATSINFV